MNQHTFAAAVAGFIFGGFAFYASHADIHASTTHPTSAPISIGELQERGVMGRLGVPLGTMVKVSGKAVTDDLRRKDAEPFLLEISAVDGKPLSAPVDYPFRERLSGRVTAPSPGDSFQFRGYETGGFDSIPHNYGDAAWQDRGFSFNTEFVVLPDK